MSTFVGMTQYMILIVYVGFMGIGLYLAILLANFLRAGTEAFRLYVRKNR